MGKGKKRSKKAPVPLAPPPAMKSRRLARVTTTLFHRHTSERDLALQRGDAEGVAEAEKAIESIGGREAYQKASQLSTSHHSTSRWVLGVLGSKGWLQGINVSAPAAADDDNDNTSDGRDKQSTSRKKRKKIPKRNVRLLEVGAINRELLDAAARTRRIKKSSDGITGDTDASGEIEEESVYRLEVRAIDLRSSQPGIEEADFLQLPLVDADLHQRYDVVVCSMVLNCVTTPEDRGRMLTLLLHQLRPGGLCFLTLPRLCLSQSRYTTPELFRSMLLDGVGFQIVQQKESPKVSFFVLQRPINDDRQRRRRRLDSDWTKKSVRNRAKKFRNDFAYILNEDEINGIF